jgi:hypothetical protein
MLISYLRTRYIYGQLHDLWEGRGVEERRKKCAMGILVRRVETVLAAVVDNAVSVLKQAFEREKERLGVCWGTLGRSLKRLLAFINEIGRAND